MNTTRIVLLILRVLLILLLWPLVAEAQGEPRCDDCVEDVVVETTDGRWLSGYIFWHQHPFHYLNLDQARDRRELERGNGGSQEIRLWSHAVALSRNRLPPSLGTPPASPIPANQYLRRDDEVALLVGEPSTLSLDSIQRLYPRNGSGLPAIRISVEQLVELAGEALPFHDQRGGECLGCPMTVEAVTILLRSGEWVSGLTLWHAASNTLQGYDFREGADTSRNKFGFERWPDTMFLWTDAVGTPRRKFESVAELAWDGLDIRQGFWRLAEAVFVLGAPRVIQRSDLALVLPGPSLPRYPFLIERADAERLLLEPPTLTMEAIGNPQLHCLAYGADVTLEELVSVCDPRAIEDFEDRSGVLHPLNLVVRSPGFGRQLPTVPSLEEARLITLVVDGGT